MSDQGIITLEGVHKSFNGVSVLAGVDLTVREGETLVIIGRSGTGKSVALNTMICSFLYKAL
ncbi:MAG: FtsK/SpoIIIE domain-containing protein, partial [Candidatus Thorarchaeota archaeon]